MELFNKLLAQASDGLRSMTPGKRITAGLLAMAVIASLGYLIHTQFADPGVYLMESETFSSGEVSAMAAAFSAANLSGYQIEGNRIRVPRGQQPAYLAALAAKNALPQNMLPQNLLDYFDRALNDGSMPFLTDRHQREAKLKLERQRVLSAIIAKMPGVENATVLWDEEQKPGFLKPAEKTASVSVKMRGAGELDESLASAIRRLVAKSIVGMKYETVLVLDSNGHTFFGDAEGPGSAGDDSYRDRKRADEKEWRTKILRALAWIPGVRVEVNADLDKEQSRRERELRPAKAMVPATDWSHGLARESMADGPQAAFVANRPTALWGTAGFASTGGAPSSEADRPAPVDTQRETVTVGMTTKRVSANIGVPTRYFEQVWRSQHANAAESSAPSPAELSAVRDEETAKIKRCVAALLPSSDSVGELTELVTITEIPNIAPPSVPDPPAQDPVVDWLVRYWPNLGLAAVVVVGLIVLRSTLRGAAPPRVAARADQSQEPEDASVSRPWRVDRPAASGPSLKAELADRVAGDPGLAANILRTWIGNMPSPDTTATS